MTVVTNETERSFTAAQVRAELDRRADRVAAVIAGRSLLDFTRFTFEPEFIENWHHRVIADEIDAWLRAERPYHLMVLVPPRHSKSELCARRLPGYIFGRNPDAEILFAGYSADLANDHCRDAQQVICSRRYGMVFPEVRLAGGRQRHAGTAVRKAAGFDVVGRKGRFRAAGVGGAFTGRGADYGIIDDPLKGRKEAESATVRKTCIDWYRSVFRTRLYRTGRMLMLLTRWHREDLAGWCIEQMRTNPDADQWRVVSLPAQYEQQEFNHPLDRRRDGQVLWPQRYPAETLRKIKATLGGYDWNALYQQRPDPPGGAVFKRYWAKLIDPQQVPAGLCWVRAWDLAVTAKTKASCTAGGQMAVDSDMNLYVRGFVREQWQWPRVEALLTEIAVREGISVGIEAQGTQKGFFQSLLAKPALADVDLRAYDADRDKLTRALPWMARAEAGKFHVVKDPGCESYLDELVAFTGHEDAYDDQVDWTSLAYRMLLEYAPVVFQVLGSYDQG